MIRLNKKLVLVGVLTLIASLLPDIIVRVSLGFLPSWWLWAKIILLIAFTLYFLIASSQRNLAKYTVVLTTIIAAQLLMGHIEATTWWPSYFPSGSFSGQFSGAILLKFLGIIPVLVVLLLLYRSPYKVYLSKGDLSKKASGISWLGIEPEKISWGRLSVISAVLIAAGTFLLTLLTVTGFSSPATLNRLPSLLPAIVLLALVNSLSEGVVYRSSVLGPLKDELQKNNIVLVAAVFFGIAHYYGAPSGILGVIMSGVLGWFMCRSMYETQGFLAAWTIHFLQDVVIFSTVALQMKS